MEVIFMGTTALASGAALFCFMRWQKAQNRAHALEVQLASAGGLDDLKSELEETEEALEAARAEIIGLNKDREKDAALIAQKEEALKGQLENFEKLKEEFMQAARASALQATSEMTNKVLEDHKREVSKQNEAQSKRENEAQQKFAEQFNALTQSVAKIQKATTDNEREVQTVMRALTHPAGAGYMSEVGLENSLKNLGLEPGRDFMMQYHIGTDEGGAYRPDAVIFLPQDMVMVIDSKASKFWIELAEAEGTEQEAAVTDQFMKSMQQHIKALSQKQYGDEVQKILKKQGKQAGLVFNVMYLPSEAAIEKLRRHDPSIGERCEKANLFMAGPASLSMLFSLANQQISAAKRDANQQKIIEQIRELMGSLSVMFTHVERAGKGIKSAADHFAKFTSSANRNVLPKLNAIQALGVDPAKNKPLPQPLKSYDVIDRDEVMDMQADEDEEGNVTPLLKNGA